MGHVGVSQDLGPSSVVFLLLRFKTTSKKLQKRWFKGGPGGGGGGEKPGGELNHPMSFRRTNILAGVTGKESIE